MPDQYGNPFQGMLNPNMRQTSLWDLRMMSAANRSETPFERGGRGTYRNQGMRGDPSLAGLAAMGNEPDYSQFTFDPAAHAQAQQYLSQYGLSPLEANQVKQNTVLPNSGFFGNHPRLSAALEGGMFGALASHGGETPGESIQGALEGLVGGQRMRQGLYNQQFARPFEAAGMMEQMQDMSQKRQLQGAQIKRYQDESDIQRERAETESIRANNELNRINATRPVPVEGGTYVYKGGGPPTIGPDALVNMNKPGWQLESGAGRPTSGASTNLDIGTREQLKIAGVNPVTATPNQIADANRKSQAQAIQRAGAQAGAGAGARDRANLPYKNYEEASKAHDQRVGELNRQMLKQDDPQHQKMIKEQIMQEWASPNSKHTGSWMPAQADVQGRIRENNSRIQQQIDAENASFKNDWPQAMEKPNAPKGAKSNIPVEGKNF
jgi:hypothetical protein